MAIIISLRSAERYRYVDESPSIIRQCLKGIVACALGSVVVEGWVSGQKKSTSRKTFGIR